MNRRRTRGTTGIAALAALLLLGSACAGPRTPVDVGVKEFPTDVLLGLAASEIPLEPPKIPTNPVITPPRRPVTPPTGLPSPAPEPECPTADPLSAPKKEAFNRAISLPVETSYRFRTTGTVTIGEEKLEIPKVAVRTVSNAERVDEDSYTFEVLDQLGQVKTLQRYLVVERAETEVAAKRDAGIFISETVRKDGTDEAVTYTWDPPIALVLFPIEAGDTWDVVSTALDGQAVMRFTGLVGVPGEPDPDDPASALAPPIVDPKVRVDACGEYLDAWNVTWGAPDPTGEPTGRFVDIASDTQLTFMDSYRVSTQYGGIIVSEVRSAEGDSAGEAITSERESTIDVIPALPKE